MEEIKEVTDEMTQEVTDEVVTTEATLMDAAMELIRSTKLRFDENTLSIDEEGLVVIDPRFANDFKRFKSLSDRMETELDNFRAHLTEFLDSNDKKEKYESNGIKFSYTSSHTRTFIDSDQLREDLPAVAKIYSKTKDVKASSRISVVPTEKYEW